MVGLLRDLRPDIVTTGNRQCSMSGPAFAAALKADPALREVPVVFVTAFSEQDELWKLLRAVGLDPDRQVAGYVSKPFARESLVAAIRRALPGAGVKQELSLDDVLANLLSNGPPISGPEPLGKPGPPDVILGRRFFSSSIWDVEFRALGPAARTERIARLFETDPEVARWFHSPVARHGTSTLLVLAAVLGTREGETTGPG